MKVHKVFTMFIVLSLLISGVGAFEASADSTTINFETYSVGSVHLQDGWSSSGSAGSGCAAYDHALVDATSYGYPSFGTRSLRMSNAVTSGCFGDQTFSKSLADEAGESTSSDAYNGGLSGGTRQPYFEAQWDFASTIPGAEQPGLSVVASPDRGDGARMGWIQMADTPSGLEVNFYDYQISALSPTGEFVFTNVVSGLDRTIPHTIKVSIYFVDGPENDVVNVFVDGTLMHTGTTWEDYFRQNQPPGTRTVDSILFRTAGTAAPATSGYGFLVDNLTLFSGPVTQCTSTCYVDGTYGNDAFGGTSPSDAKKTIQAAIDQVDSGGLVITAPGTYGENLDIAKPLTIEGAGNGTNPLVDTIIDASGGSFGIYMHRPTNLSDLRIIGASLDGIRVYRLASDSRLNFENATWQNIAAVANGAKGVEIHNDTDVSNLTIINSEFVGNVGQGLRTASNATVDGLMITDSSFNQNSYGIYLQGTVNGLTILRSSFNDSVRGYGGYMTETGSLTNMVVEDSQFNRNVVGLMVWNTVDNSDLLISGTVFQDNDKWGALIWGNTLTNVLIRNSDVLNNDGLGAGYYGIDFYTYADVMNNVAVHYTNITGHTAGGGLKNRNAVDSAQVNATCNWWGAADGPSGSGMGSGDAVTDYVTFTPWLVSEAPDGPCTGMPDTEGPVTTEVEANPNPAAVGSSVTLTANVDDTNTGGSSVTSAEYSLDGGPWTMMSASDSSFDEVSEGVTANFTASGTPGIYNLCVRGTDEPGNVGEPECIMFVVYDPNGGFVTGGGWFMSPEGAYKANLSLTGKATFGFVAKYKKGATIPDGNTEFQFKAGDLNFKSTSYEWLVVNQGGTNAQFKGYGTINGAGNYGFMLWAGDGSLDTFRIKIWDAMTEEVVYDNGPDQPIGGGSIVIHKK